MAYSPPIGNNIVGIFPAAAYSPPDPTDIIGIFPADAPPTRRLLIASMCSGWAASDAVDVGTALDIPPVIPADLPSEVAWSNCNPADRQADAVWPPSIARDAQPQLMSWDAYNHALVPVTSAIWSKSVPTDSPNHGVRWQPYQAHLSTADQIRWPGSTPVDRMLSANYLGNITPAWREITEPLADPDNIMFSVMGGGLLAIFPAGDDTPPAGDNIVGIFPDGGDYIAPAMLYPGTQDLRVPFRTVDFVVGLQRVPVLDAAGNQVYRSAVVDSGHQSPWGPAIDRSRQIIVPWLKYSRPLSPGWGVIVPGGDPQPGPGEQIIIPVRRVYIVRNETLVVRADTLAQIHVMDLSITIEADSLASFSGRINRRQLDLVNPLPSPVEIIVWINGIEFRFLVDKISQSKRFGDHSLSISGRCPAAELSADFAPITTHSNSIPMTAQQLVSAALEFTGYDIDWQIDDWAVPAGQLSLTGAPLDVASYVASTVGAVLQCDRVEKTLRFSPRYPVAPWGWPSATPDLIIPASACQLVAIEPSSKPDYNRIFVSGTTAGIIGQVTIAGTAGDLVAPMVTHPLITHSTAARQRGIAELGSAGPKTNLQLQLQVLDGVGIIELGRLAEFDGATRGIVRGNRITAGSAPRQTIILEVSA